MLKIRITFVSIAMVLLMIGIANGKARPRYQMQTRGPAVDSREWLNSHPVQGRTTGRNFGHRISVGSTASPGTAVGTTYYDFQHNNSTGRQVGEFDGRIQVSWMKAPGPSPSVRTINWNRIDVIGGAVSVTLDNGDTVRVFPLGSVTPDGQEFTAVRPGYTNLRLTPTGSAAVGFHDAPETGGVQYWAAHVDLSTGNGLFGDQQRSPNPAGPEYQADSPIWPKFAISECGGELIHHAIGTWSGARNEIWYWRGIVSGWDIDWTGFYGNLPLLVEPTDATLSAVIEANGSEVTIALFKQIGTVNADVIRYVSTDCGVTWPDSLSYENITNYNDSDVDGAGNHLSAAYDDAGNIHLLWDAVPSSGLVFPSNLYHWSAFSGIHLVTSAGWINSCGSGGIPPSTNNGAGARNRAISDVELSVKPPGQGPGEGIADELIYAIWTQYGPSDDDCATVDDQGTLGGLINAEIYCSVSSTGGISWDRPANLTGTVTPNCAPGDCLSESWITAAATADSGVYISYVLDLHAGAAVLGEGIWTDNPYMVLAVEARQPVLEGILAVYPEFFAELNADPGGGPETVELNIMNVGNAELYYLVEVTTDNGGASHVTVNGGADVSGTIPAGGAPDVITVSYDCIGLGDPEELAWRLEVSTPPDPDPGSGWSATDIILQVFSASTWYTCDEDTLSTGQYVMQVSSCLEMGDRGRRGVGFYDVAEPHEWMYSGSPMITRVTADGEIVAYHNAYMNAPDRTRALNRSFRAQSDLLVTRDSTLTVGESTYVADVAQGLWSTTDTTIGGTYEIVFPKGPRHQNGAFWKFTMGTLTGEDIPNVSYGVIADIDAYDPNGNSGDSISNAGIVNEEQSWVGAEYYDTNFFFHAAWYVAVFHLPLSSGCPKDEGVAGQVLSNSNYAVNRFDVDSLYMLTQLFGGAGSWSSTIHIDTGQQFEDVSVLLVSGFEETLVNGSPITWGYGIAVSDVSRADLTERINATRLLATAECQFDCPIELAGDVNESTAITSADIIYMVGFVFKGGAAPLPCEASGDVDCSGDSNSADIIYLVNYVFKSGPDPCDICFTPFAQSCIS